MSGYNPPIETWIFLLGMLVGTGLPLILSYFWQEPTGIEMDLPWIEW